MSDFSKIKELLEKKLDILEARVDRIDDDLSQPNDTDWADKGKDLEGDEVLEEVGEMTEHNIVKVKLALSKIEDNTYGVCEECDVKISTNRLEALPYASMCIKCSELADKNK